MDQKRVRNSTACEVCRKRRGKCTGSAPCTYCVEHNQLCVFSATIKKRGPTSKKQKGLFNFTEGAFALQPNPDAEYKYMGEYLNHFFFLPPLNQDGIHNPTTPAHHMMRYVLLSHMSRSFGAIARSEEFISTARQVSGQVFDDPSYDSGVAFMLLADICLANGDARASHYASVAWNHAKVLSRNDWSNIHLQLQSFVMCNMLDTSLTPEQKQQQLFTYASQLLDADVLTTIISGLMLKTGAVGLILNGTSCKEAGLLSCLKNLTVEYSIVEIMNDLDKLERYVQNTPPIQKWVLLLFAKIFRTMLQIQQGSFAEASQAARAMVEISNRPEIRHIVKNELFLPVIMPNLATLGSLSKVVVELYHFTQQLEKNAGPNPGPNSGPTMATYILKQEAADEVILPSYSPTQTLPSMPTSSPPQPLPSPLCLPLVGPSPRASQTSQLTPPPPPPPQFLPARSAKGPLLPISKQPNLQHPTQQPTLQLTLQHLFQEGINSRSPFAACALPAAVPISLPSPPNSTSLTLPLPPSPVVNISPPLTPPSLPLTSSPLTPPSLPLPSSPLNSSPPTTLQPEPSLDEDFLWWQPTEKVDDIWPQDNWINLGPRTEM